MGHDGLLLGLGTFGSVTAGADGRLLSHPQVVRNVVEEGVLADQVGADHFVIGEHHRDDFAISSPEIALTAIAARTARVRLGTAVTVLSSDDPVRVYERFATLDAVSDGRAEITVGRGSFTESFPLFGFDLTDYEVLFEEKLELLVKLQSEDPVTWSGATRGALKEQRVYPTTGAGTIPVWVGVGGSPESVLRAARHGLPLMLAIIGGNPDRFLPYADLYRRATTEFGFGKLPVGVHSGGFLARSDEEARDILYPSYKAVADRIGGERGWPPTNRERFEHEADHGSLYVGSPETVARKIVATVKSLGLSRFDFKYDSGILSHESMMSSIELFGKEVIPRVRQAMGHSSTTSAA